MNYQLNYKGPEYLSGLKGVWEDTIPEVGSPGFKRILDKIFEEGSSYPSSKIIQSIFILKALTGREKKRLSRITNKLWEEGKIDLDEAMSREVQEQRLAYPILSYEQLRSKIPTKVRMMKKQDSVIKTEEELISEGYSLVFEEPYQGVEDTRGTWRDSEGYGANREKYVVTSLPWEHTLEDLVDEEYVKEF
jgi:hypothetical protein